MKKKGRKGDRRMEEGDIWGYGDDAKLEEIEGGPI